MLASERFSKIIEITNSQGFVSTKDLSKTFNVSETTIRRDSEELEEQGLLIRVHGGVKSIKNKTILSTNDETRMSARALINFEAKDIVSKKAARFIRDGDCVFLDGGSSIADIINYIGDKKVKIVTHSTLIADKNIPENIELFFIGGKYMPEYNMSVGPITMNNLKMFNFDQAFISCAGIDIFKKEVYTAEMDTTAIKQQAISQSVKNYLLVDTSKFEVKGFCSFINSDDFDAVICNKDERIDEEEIPNNFIIVE